MLSQLTRRALGWPALATALTLACVFTAPAATIDNFDDGDDVGWTHIDVLDMYGLGPTIYDASSGAYHIASGNPLPPTPSLVGTGSLWTPSAADPYYSDGLLRMRFTTDNLISNPFGAMRMDPILGNYYTFFAIPEGAGTIGISRVTGLTDSDDLVSMDYAITPGQWYWMEAGAVGNTLTLKVWAEGTTEPVLPQLTTTDDAFTLGALTVGLYKFASSSGTISAQFDDVSFVPEPSGLALVLALGLLLRRR